MSNSNAATRATLAETAAAYLRESIAARQAMAATQVPELVLIAEALARSLKAGGKILFCGNGGSAAEAQHMAAEFVGVLNHDFPRAALAAVALSTDTSILTAVANDYGFERIFSRQVEALAQPGDVLVAYSTSGTSKNVVAAASAAKERGCVAVAMTGAAGGTLAAMCELSFRAPSGQTEHVQELHTSAGHIICRLVEILLFGELRPPGK
jgi:D-sedoheptulose 7-phosphate isomerase